MPETINDTTILSDEEKLERAFNLARAELGKIPSFVPWQAPQNNEWQLGIKPNRIQTPAAGTRFEKTLPEASWLDWFMQGIANQFESNAEEAAMVRNEELNRAKKRSRDNRPPNLLELQQGALYDPSIMKLPSGQRAEQIALNNAYEQQRRVDENLETARAIAPNEFRPPEDGLQSVASEVLQNIPYSVKNMPVSWPMTAAFGPWGAVASGLISAQGEGRDEGTGVYWELRSRGVPHEEAYRRASLHTDAVTAGLMFSDPLENLATFGLGKLFPKMGKTAKAVTGFAVDMLGEGAEEGGEKIGEYLSLGDPINWGDVGYAAGMGALSGGIMGAGMGAINSGIDSYNRGQRKQQLEQYRMRKKQARDMRRQYNAQDEVIWQQIMHEAKKELDAEKAYGQNLEDYRLALEADSVRQAQQNENYNRILEDITEQANNNNLFNPDPTQKPKITIGGQVLPEHQELVQNEDVAAANADVRTVQNTQTRPTGSLMDIINTLQAGQDRIDALTGNNRQGQVFDAQNEVINQQREAEQNRQNEAARQNEQRRYDEFLGNQNDFLRGMPAAQNTQTAAAANTANVNMPVNDSENKPESLKAAAERGTIKVAGVQMETEHVSSEKAPYESTGQGVRIKFRIPQIEELPNFPTDIDLYGFRSYYTPEQINLYLNNKKGGHKKLVGIYYTREDFVQLKNDFEVLSYGFNIKNRGRYDKSDVQKFLIDTITKGIESNPNFGREDEELENKTATNTAEGVQKAAMAIMRDEQDKREAETGTADKKYGLPDGYTIEGSEDSRTLKGAKKHQFVLRNGKHDWGYVTEALTKGRADIPVGAIRVQVGQKGWGLKHAKLKHLNDALENYQSVEEYIGHIIDDADEIIPLEEDNKGRPSEFLIAGSKSKNKRDAIVIAWDKDNEYYTLKSAYSPKADYVARQKSLSSGNSIPTSSPASTPIAYAADETEPGDNDATRYGNNDLSNNIPQASEGVKATANNPEDNVKLGMAIAKEEQDKRTAAAMKKTQSTVTSETAQSEQSANVTASMEVAEQIKYWLLGNLENPFSANKKITTKNFLKMCEKAFGGTLAEGKFTMKDAYDALEMGVNQAIKTSGVRFAAPQSDTDITRHLGILSALVKNLPTQTAKMRTEEQNEFQQFSTPPHIAYIANWLANISENDVVLEPSAGVGGLAVFAKTAGAEVVMNELSPRRAALLEAMGLGKVYRENAEHINDILPDTVKPTRIVMNPPFSATAGRVEGQRRTSNAYAHVEQALARLEDGGRLVAILGKGMNEDAPAHRDWWRKIKSEYNVRANVLLDGQEYKKYGTTFGNVIVVIDKNGATPENGTVTGSFEKVSDMITPLMEVRNSAAQTQTKADQSVEVKKGSKTAAASEAKTAKGQEQIKFTITIPGTINSNGTTGEIYNLTAVSSEDGKFIIKNDGRIYGEYDPKTGKFTFTYTLVINDKLLTADNDNEVRKFRDKITPRIEEALKKYNQPSGKIAKSESAETERVTTPEVQPEKSVAAIKTENKTEAERQAERKSDNSKDENYVFDDYKPSRLKIEGSKHHPADLVESAAMASISMPEITYSPHLDEKIIKEGRLSDAQLEAVVYAGQAFKVMNKNGSRRGFFIGDGTGLGKGREIAGIITDQMNQGHGNGKAVWVSMNIGLLKDAQRDYSGIGNNPDDIFAQDKTKKGDKIKDRKGIIFTKYSFIRNEDRLNQLKEWLGADFDGVIALDEVHNANNASDSKGARGTKKASLQALGTLSLVDAFPKARVLYVSATGATEVRNLAMLERLGLWGEGTQFANQQEFVNSIEAGGKAAMEVVARDLKAMGLYVSRSISQRAGTYGGNEDVTFARLSHNLTEEQTAIYNKIAEAWRYVYQNVKKAIELCGGKRGGGKSLGTAAGAFYNLQQKCFNQIVTALQTPAVIQDIKKQLAAGNSVLIQLTNTDEAALKNAIAGLSEDETLEDLDVTPKDKLIQFLKGSFPVQKLEEYEDENHNIQVRKVVDSEGNPVLSKEAVAMRDRLIAEVNSIRFPESPIDMIINAFGAENVAEVTGRTQRVVRDSSGKLVREKRSLASRENDKTAFNEGRKRILIFSEAGGTGASYHASRDFKNQQKRVHYLLQAGWRADVAVQGLGRSHRSNEAHKPHYVLVETDIPGQKRFLSTIARRLEQLGALTTGERKAASNGLFSERDNLESVYAKDALESLCRDMRYEHPDYLQAMGYNIKSGTDFKTPPITQFLNRILLLDTDEQKEVFEDFAQRIDAKVAEAIQNGTFDVGMETVRADKISVKQEQSVYKDNSNGIETKYVELEVLRKQKPLDIGLLQKQGYITFYKNRDGKVIAARRTGGQETDYQTGAIKTKYELRSPDPYYHSTSSALDNKDYYTKLGYDEAAQLWAEQSAALPEYHTEKQHMITGALLPIWNSLKGSPRIRRVVTEDGRTILGRIIPPAELNRTLKNLGAQYNGEKFTPQNVFKKLGKLGASAHLSNGWELKTVRVYGENRIEIRNLNFYNVKEFEKAGAIVDDSFGYQRRVFIPTGNEAIMQKVLDTANIVEFSDEFSEIEETINENIPDEEVSKNEYFNQPVVTDGEIYEQRTARNINEDRMTETYGDDKALRSVSTSKNVYLRSVALALDEAAEKVGEINGDLSIKDDILAAVNALDRINEAGLSVNASMQYMMNDTISQLPELKDVKLSHTALRILGIFDKYKGSGAKIAAALNKYSELAMDANNQGKSKTELLRQAVRYLDAADGYQLDLEAQRLETRLTKMLTTMNHSKVDAETAAIYAKLITNNYKYFARATGKSIDELIKARDIEFIADGIEKRGRGRPRKVNDTELNQETGKTGTRRGFVEFVNGKQGTGEDVSEHAKAIVHVLQNADKSTVIHETAHVFLQNFRDLAQDPNLSEAARNDWKALTKWLGIENIDFSKPLSEADSRRWHDAHEKFAAGAEKYFTTGKPPVSRLKRLFEIIKGWFASIYKGARDIKYINTNGDEVPFNISSAAREVYDHIYSGESLETPSWKEERAAYLEVGEADPDVYLTPEKLKDNEFVETTDDVDAAEVAEIKAEQTAEAEKAEAARAEREQVRTELRKLNGFESESDSNNNSYLFSDIETEKRFRLSRGDIRVRESVRDFWKHGGLKPLGRQSASGENLTFAKGTLTKLVQRVSAATGTAKRQMTGIIYNLTPEEMELFLRKRILDDLMWRKSDKPDAKLPWGLTDEALRRDHERITRLAERNENVMNAIKADEDVLHGITNEMISVSKKLGMDLEAVLRNPHYFHHEILFYDDLENHIRAQNLALKSGNKRITGIKSFDDLIHLVRNRGYYKKFEGSERDMSSNYIQITSDVRGQMLQDLAIMNALVDLKEKYDISDKLRAKIKEIYKSADGETYSQSGIDGIENLNDLVPPGYVVYEPTNHGLLSSDGDSLISMAADRGVEFIMKRLGLGEEAANAIVEGRVKQKGDLWVIPKELAESLDGIAKAKAPTTVKKILKKLTSGWKFWQTTGFTQTIKYQLRNISGDLDVVFAGNPRSLYYVPEAFADLGKYATMGIADGELEQFLQRGGDLSGETAQYFKTTPEQDLSQLENDPEYQYLKKELRKAQGLKGLSKRGLKAAYKYSLGFIAKVSSYRENLLRYATYLSYLEQMKKNPDGMPDNWGASNKDEVMALTDIRDRAFKMANELLGDYDSISELGMRLRDVIIPFYSWMEVNAKRYWRLLRNGFSSDSKVDFLAGFLKGKLFNAPLYAYRAVRTALFVNILSMIVKLFNIWNGDADDDLPPEIKNRPHLTLGYTKDGKVSYFDRLGAMLDLYDWVGLDSRNIIAPFYHDMKAILNGDMTWGDFWSKVKSETSDFAMQAPGAVFSKAINSLNPMIKMPFEIATGRTLFPDATHPRTIRDLKSYVAQTFGLAPEINALFDEPGRPYLESRGWGLLRYTSDPKEGAYFYILDKVRRFQERELGKTFDGGAITRRGEALRKLKTAIRYKDRKNIRYYLRKYYQLGGTRKNLEQSVQRMGPLSGLNKEEKAQFMRTLSVEDRKYLRRAMRYFAELSATLGVKAKLF